MFVARHRSIGLSSFKCRIQAMYHRCVFSSLAILLSCVLAACTNISTPSTSNSQRQEVSTQPSIRSTPNPESIQRVVALTSLSADIITRLDRTKLVGMPGSRLLNSDKQFEKVTRVSEGRSQPNLEKIVALKPDLVVGARGFHDQTAQKLEQLGIKTLLTDVDSWKTLEDLTKTLAQSLKSDPQPLLNQYKSVLSQPPDNPSSTLVLVSYQPILSPNKTSWCGDMLDRFNIKNLTAELQGNNSMQGYVSLSPEKILAANPDVLIVVETGDKILEQFQSKPFWNQLKAVQNQRVYVFDYYGLVNPGSIDAIEKAASQLKQIASGSKPG
jgi:iron complex transport system substrate-binding protein